MGPAHAEKAPPRGRIPRRAPPEGRERRRADAAGEPIGTQAKSSAARPRRRSAGRAVMRRRRPTIPWHARGRALRRTSSSRRRLPGRRFSRRVSTFLDLGRQIEQPSPMFLNVGRSPSSSRRCRCLSSAFTAYRVTNLPHGRAAGRLGRRLGRGEIGRVFEPEGQAMAVSAGAHYNVVRPRDGAEWQARIGVTSMFPK